MARRPNGHGALFKDKHRPSAPWAFVKRILLADGTMRTVKTRGRTQKDAIAKMEKREAELIVTVDQQTTVADFMRDWLKAKKPLIRASTYRGYEQDIRLYIDPHMGLKRLDRVNARDAQTLVSKIAEAGKLTTADRVRRTLRHALEQAMQWGSIAKNPAALVPAVKKPTPNRGSWSMVDAQRFLAEAMKKGPTWYALFILALVTGMRKGELLALRWQDVGKDRIYVRRNYTPYGETQFVDPKTKHGRRVIPVTPSTMVALDRLRTSKVLGSQLVATPQVLDPEGEPVNLPASDLVFPGRNGPMNPKRPNVVMRQIIDKANVPIIRFHDLRRTYATWMIVGGHDPKTVQYLMGQATPTFTLTVYADATAETELAALDLAS